MIPSSRGRCLVTFLVKKIAFCSTYILPSRLFSQMHWLPFSSGSMGEDSLLAVLGIQMRFPVMTTTRYDEYGPDRWLDEGLVVVTVNYRGGALGFLSLGTPEVTFPHIRKPDMFTMYSWTTPRFLGTRVYWTSSWPWSLFKPTLHCLEETLPEYEQL